MPRSLADAVGGANVAAALDTIAWSELGAGLVRETDDGYNVIVGSTVEKPILFSDYSQHPNVVEKFRSKNGVEGESTAAGRYQILHRFAVAYIEQLGLPDFSPISQDKIAIQLIKECNAYKLLQEGMFYAVIPKIASRWASLPGAGYNQNEHTIEFLRSIYVQRGGVVND